MATDLSQLISDFYSYFLGLYHQTKTPPASAAGPQPAAGPAAAPAAASAAHPGAFIAFESIGTPMTPEMFKLQSGDFDPGLQLQQFTLRANMIPVIDGSNISAPGLLSVDGAYALMLEEAQPLTAADAEAFDHIKRSAKEAFDNAVGNYSIPGLSGEFHPAIPGPPNWASPAGASAWTSRSFQQTETVTVSSPAPQSTRTPPRPLPKWGWRVAPAELAPALRSPQAVVTTVPPRPIAVPAAQAVAAHPVVFRPLVTSAIASRAALSTVAGAASPPQPTTFHVANAPNRMVLQMAAPVALHAPPASASPALAVATHVTIRADVMALHVQELGQCSTPQAITSKNFKLSFDYCLVQASRDWLSGSFLIQRNWYLPHTKAGEIASGTGTGSGSFEVLPVAAIVAQNLVIEADWSHDDTATLQSIVNFGPFSLVGRTIDQTKNTLSCQGMQIVAWVFEPMPCLPPNGDPTMT
jgi:hypothetical protein